MKLPIRSTGPAIRERGGPLAGAARDRAGTVIDAARPHVSHAAEVARGTMIDTVVPAVASTANRVADSVGPVVASTASRVADVARDDVAPKVTAAVGAALHASEPAREEAMARGGAVIAALKGEVVAAPKRKSHKLRRSLGLVALLAAAGAGWTAFQRRRAGDPWSVPSVPHSPAASITPPTAPVTAASAGPADDMTARSGDPLLSESLAADGIADLAVTPVLDTSDPIAAGDLLPDGPDEDVKDLR